MIIGNASFEIEGTDARYTPYQNRGNIILVDNEGSFYKNSGYSMAGIAEIPLSYFSVSDLTITEGESGNITISRTGGSNTVQNLTLASSNGTALAGTDYTAINQTITFAKGETSKTVSIASIEDTTTELDETFTLTLTASSSDAVPAQITDGSATVTIADSITLSSQSISASELISLDAQYSGTVNASSVNTITGTAADINTVYASSGISGLGNEVIIITDTSINASALINLDVWTTGVVNAAAITTITGTVAQLTSVFASNTAGTITGLGNEAITISDNITVAQANVVAAQTTGVVTATISDGDIATLTGLTETGNAYTMTVTDASVSASALNTLNAKTTGVVTVQATTITGTAADINTAYTSNAAGTITGLGNEAVTITDTSINASALITLDAFTSGIINASSITTLTGSASDQATVRASSGISGLLSGFTQIGSDIDGSAGDLAGWSVSLSNDGNVVAFGSPINDGNGTSSGCLRIYKNINNTWTQVGSDINGEASGDQSGLSVSLSADGSIVAFGSPYNDGNGSGSGHVRIYKISIPHGPR